MILGGEYEVHRHESERWSCSEPLCKQLLDYKASVIAELNRKSKIERRAEMLFRTLAANITLGYLLRAKGRLRCASACVAITYSSAELRREEVSKHQGENEMLSLNANRESNRWL